MKPMDFCPFGELLATIECSSKFSKQLLSAKEVGWNQNGSVTASEPFSSFTWPVGMFIDLPEV